MVTSSLTSAFLLENDNCEAIRSEKLGFLAVGLAKDACSLAWFCWSDGAAATVVFFFFFYVIIKGTPPVFDLSHLTSSLGGSVGFASMSVFESYGATNKLLRSS